MTDIRNSFPLLANNPDLIYLDNAATTQKPEVMLQAMDDFYRNYNSNVHRGLYPIAEKATLAYEAARTKIAKFINAEPEEIIFTSGTTQAVNMLAYGLRSSKIITAQPVILTSEAEHHSNLLPWQQIAEGQLTYLSVNPNTGELTPNSLKIDPEVLALTYISNVTGAITDIKTFRENYPNSYIVLDAAQAIAHMPIDVKDLDIDFMTFSGHKIYGPTGIGVLYGKKNLLEKLSPAYFGGGMIREVNRTNATWAPLPDKFESGTPPIAEAIGLGSAIDFLNSLGWDYITQTEEQLSKYTYESLNNIKGIKLFHPQNQHTSVFSFALEDIHPHDLAQLLGEKNICVRAGHHCTQILHREVLQVPATTRVSLAIYNTESEIDKLVGAILQAQNILQ